MWMNHPSTARRGIFAGVVAMMAAIGGTLFVPNMNYTWIVIPVLAGFVLGIPLAMVPLTGRAPANRPVPRLRRPGRGTRGRLRILSVLGDR